MLPTFFEKYAGLMTTRWALLGNDDDLLGAFVCRYATEMAIYPIRVDARNK